MNDDDFIQCLGGLSNYVNAILHYDETFYLRNGFEDEWDRFGWFKKNTEIFINPIDPKNLKIDWKSPESYADMGLKNYLITTNHLETDLFISPKRAKKIIETNIIKKEDNLDISLRKIDEQIKSQMDSLWFEDTKIGIEKNFVFPSLTHYVLSQASNIDDLLTVIIQIKDSGIIEKIRKRINEISSDIKLSSKFQKEIERLIKESFGEQTHDKPWSLKFTVSFITLTKSFNLDFFRRKEHLLFLKDIISCRTETYKLERDIKRIFKRTINKK